MYALPGQTLEQALADIEQALALGARHLSAYHLTLEPNTCLPPARRPICPTTTWRLICRRPSRRGLAAAGFVHYETSAFALPGHQARHNLNYWTFGDYLGIMPARTASCRSRPHPARYATKQPAAYLAGVAQAARCRPASRWRTLTWRLSS